MALDMLSPSTCPSTPLLPCTTTASPACKPAAGLPDLLGLFGPNSACNLEMTCGPSCGERLERISLSMFQRAVASALQHLCQLGPPGRADDTQTAVAEVYEPNMPRTGYFWGTRRCRFRDQRLNASAASRAGLSGVSRSTQGRVGLKLV